MKEYLYYLDFFIESPTAIPRDTLAILSFSLRSQTTSVINIWISDRSKIFRIVG